MVSAAMSVGEPRSAPLYRWVRRGLRRYVGVCAVVCATLSMGVPVRRWVRRGLRSYVIGCAVVCAAMSVGAPWSVHCASLQRFFLVFLMSSY